ncbi:MAG TPA: TMEM175 family protein [Acidimicrobiia bacterium]|nr:TMEM175 family protein [Acidimicrobiia bacterium]
MSDVEAGTSSGRVEAFSDAVIAIAITLLVLEIRVPVLKDGESLSRALLDLWPKYATFAVSFLTIGVMWINHHTLFERIQRVDRRLLFVNLFLLMAISFVPFPTAVLGDYVQNAQAGHAAAALYGINMLLVGVGFLGLWMHLAAHPELRVASFTDDDVRQALRRTVIGPLTYVVAIVVSFISAPAALAMYAAIVVYFAVGQISLTKG